MFVHLSCRKVAMRALKVPVVLDEVTLEIQCSLDFVLILRIFPAFADRKRGAGESKPEQKAQVPLVYIHITSEEQIDSYEL